MCVAWKTKDRVGQPYHPRTIYSSAPALCDWDDARAIIEMSLGFHPFCKYTSRRGFELTFNDRYMKSYIEGYFVEDVMKTEGNVSTLEPIKPKTKITNGMHIVYTILPLPRVGDKRERYGPYLPSRYKDAVQHRGTQFKKRIRISLEHYSDSVFRSFRSDKKS